MSDEKISKRLDDFRRYCQAQPWLKTKFSKKEGMSVFYQIRKKESVSYNFHDDGYVMNCTAYQLVYASKGEPPIVLDFYPYGEDQFELHRVEVDEHYRWGA